MMLADETNMRLSSVGGRWEVGGEVWIHTHTQNFFLLKLGVRHSAPAAPAPHLSCGSLLCVLAL